MSSAWRHRRARQCVAEQSTQVIAIKRDSHQPSPSSAAAVFCPWLELERLPPGRTIPLGSSHHRYGAMRNSFANSWALASSAVVMPSLAAWASNPK